MEESSAISPLAFKEDQRSEPLPVLGFRLQPNNNPSRQVRVPIDLAKSLVSTMIKAAAVTQTAHIEDFTRSIPTLGVQVTDLTSPPSGKINCMRWDITLPGPT